jgi:hypothetical protein
MGMGENEPHALLYGCLSMLIQREGLITKFGGL